ncbi:lipopolysaccharide biosynthesis protein [Treponema pectinovorum]|uniref:lipopolysaccharide biosynthesis protein n=1 Tax=Treponema pectinovorum TaxID=164 RepID=UPI003D94D406
MNKFFQKYKNLSPAVIASFWCAICAIIQKGISFFTVPIFTRLMTPSEYGNVNLFLAWESIIAIFATLNLSSGVYNVGLTKFEDSNEKFTSSLLGLSLLTTFIVFTLLGITYPISAKLLGLNKYTFFMLFIFVACSPCIEFWSQSERFNFRYKKLVFITLLLAILNPILGIFLIKYSALDNYYARIVSIVVVQFFISLPIFFALLKKSNCLYEKNFWKYALKFNLPLIPHYLSTIILSSSDRIMIGYLCDARRAGFYSVAWGLSYTVTIITSSISTSLNPYTFKKFKQLKFNDVAKVANLIIILVALCCLGFIAIAPELMHFVAPAEYQNAFRVIPPLVSCSYFIFIYSLFGNVEFYFEKSKYIMVASIVGALLNIGLNYIFIQIFDYVAAGYTSLFCYICFAFAHYAFAKRICKKNGNIKIYSNKFIFAISIIYTVLTFVLTFMYNSIIFRYSFVVAIFLLMVFFRKQIIYILKEVKTK